MLALLLLAQLVAPLEEVAPAAVEAALRPENGRARVVHVWASWCAPCVAELPELAAGLKRRSDRVDIVLLSLDGPNEARAAAQLLARARAPGRMLRVATGGALAPLRALDPAWDGAVPTTWLIAPDGRVALAQRGASDLDELFSAIDRAKPRRRR